MTNNKNNFLFLFNFIIGLIIISYTLYRRFFIIRLPKSLLFVDNAIINYGLLLFISISFFLTCYLLTNNILILINKQTKSLFYKISLKINDIIENALQEVYSFLGNILLTDPYNKISYFSQKFYKYFQNISETFFLFILYIIKLIILICFMIDVFYFFELKYFYKSLYLLCFSLLIKILFYILKDFSNNLEDAESVLIIEHVRNNSANNIPIYKYSLKEEFKYLNLTYHVGQYILCSKISGYLNTYERYKHFFSPRINIIVYFLYLIGWSYVIYLNILYL